MPENVDKNLRIKSVFSLPAYSSASLARGAEKALCEKRMTPELLFRSGFPFGARSRVGDPECGCESDRASCGVTRPGSYTCFAPLDWASSLTAILDRKGLTRLTAALTPRGTTNMALLPAA